MARRTVAEVHVTPVPPKGAVPVGVTHGRRPQQVFSQKVKRVKTDWARTPDGEFEYRQIPSTGEKLYRKRVVTEVVDETETFFQISEGNANVRKVRYTPPSPEEIAAAERARRVQETIPALAEALVDSGLTPEEIVARLRGEAPRPKTEAAPQPVKPEEEYPIHKGYGRWTLADGSEFRGKKEEAEEANRAVVAALAEAAAGLDVIPDD